MQKNFKLIIEYDGTAYHGWQRQKDLPTIQGEIEKALLNMTSEPVTLIGSGRTDAGVHATAQVAHFKSNTRIPPQAFQRGLNSLLEKDIVIKACEEVDASFHARYNVKSKIYRYRILNRPLPEAIGRQYAWFIPQKLDLDAMRTATAHILGSHDFKAFEGTGSPRSNSRRHIFKAELIQNDGDYLDFVIEANGFLKFMVRNIVGTLADVGRGKITAHDFKEILISKNRNLAGATAPPQGLCLMEVKY